MDNKELINEFNKTISSWFNPIHLENILEQWEAFKLSKSEKQPPDKDYEVLSFITLDDRSIIFYKKENGLYNCKQWPTDYFHFSELNKNELGKQYDIHSVKYLPTGDVFERGNKVLDEDGKEQIIDKFEVDELWASGISVVFDTPFRASRLPLIKHIPKPLPLFKTHDGVNIFEGDDYWQVDDKWSVWDLSKANKYSGKSTDSAMKYFSTKEAAEDYTIHNKPVFSISDVFKSVHLSVAEIDALYKVAKEKIYKEK